MTDDFADVIMAFARHNKVDARHIHLTFYPTKRAWEEAEKEWGAGVDWNILFLP